MFRYMYRTTVKHLYLFPVFLLLISCRQPPTEPSFYFWETYYKIDSTEKQYLQQLHVKKLYVRFFDITIQNRRPTPTGIIRISEKNETQEIIPVVFITNETFKALDKDDIHQLAVHIQNEINYLYPIISDQPLQEVQFDCDWTTSTSQQYFYFLQTIQKLLPEKEISATIRLHQIKYRKQTGIPPVDKGVLMYYATDNPLTAGDNNSILENKEAAKYIKGLARYPMKLDVALPIYSWAIIENELGKKRLLNGIREEILSDTLLYRKTGKNTYIVRKEHYLQQVLLYPDFRIKTESICTEDLISAAKEIRKQHKDTPYSTIYFQLNETNLKHYSIQNLNTISNP